MQEPHNVEREIFEIEHEPLSTDALEKIARIKALTGLTDAEARSLAAARGLELLSERSSLSSKSIH